MAYEYTTRDELLSLAPALNESELLVKSAQGRSYQSSTFLSYHSKDAPLLPGLIRVLEGHGAAVYIDKIDSTLPTTTGRATAATLRERIRACRKFINLATVNSKDSKWVPWELGLADGYKNPRNVAIFPGVDSRYDTAWTEREYLGIYDRIVWGDLAGHQKRLWMVLNQEANTAVTLTEWLRR